MFIGTIESEFQAEIETINSVRIAMNAELQHNIRAFEKMFEELKRDHAREHVIFYNGEFAGAYPSFHLAAEAAVHQFGTGPYLIREVRDPHVMSMPASIAYRPAHADS